MPTLVKDTPRGFDGQTIYIGIDCHKKSWKVTLLSDNFELKTMSRDADAQGLAKYLQKHYPGACYKAVYEAGFNGFTPCRTLRSLGIDAQVVHAADIPTSQKDRQRKNDTVDSRKLANTLRSQLLKGIDVPDRHLELDRSLLRLRYSLTKDLSRVKNRIKSLLFQYGISIPEELDRGSKSWTKAYVAWLESEMVKYPDLKFIIQAHLDYGQYLKVKKKEVSSRLRALAKSNNYRENVLLLQSIPGIGVVTAMTLLTQIGDIHRFTNFDRLCGYFGLMPKVHASGDRESSSGISSRGRTNVKNTLIEAAWSAVRSDPALTLRFTNLSKRMKKNKAIIRIAKNLLNRIRYVLIHREPYKYGVVC
ncbi:IS110 family RNA-guided transposase [Robertkochia sediminum]|uniref:IS110 family transposase n=1 Tax=Robertkochia sediminum TaxID=2785326 RepID=UPI0019319E12|nr:IS110 family transposase [Robertkochia sediminum]MBL7471488.1 IS110 family transposase [Robertkochia sediminum]MBL7471527.1 IS110 family transposase [Robertkochia sediminum]MBL7473068.1 IS110 family transposase [Robertkochia sediminum]MBL7473107.1 IS110 family transposase [Robertkochia sediminum]MBL7474032.1 IS110 family transposase [Robertkochia sediminum]